MARNSIITVLVVSFLAACNLTLKPPQAALDLQADYWQQLGSIVARGSDAPLALDSSGNPVVSWSEWDGTSENIYVKRWNGSSWVQVGTYLDIDTGGVARDALNPSLALDSSDNPVVSWYEWDNTSYNIYVKRWNGSSWVQLGAYLDIDTGGVARNALNPILALDSSGNPVVSWSEWDGASENIYVKRWNGGSWVQLGAILDGYSFSDVTQSSLAIDPAGKPVVSFRESDGFSYNIYVRRWDGNNWLYLGSILDVNTSTNADRPSLALDSLGNPVVSWSEDDGTSTNIYVKRWNGTSWVQVGTFLDTNINQRTLNPSLALDSSGNPVVSWSEYDGTSLNIYVKQWNGSSWNLVGLNPLDTAINNKSHSPSLSLVNGQLAVAWKEGDGGNYDSLYVKKYITNAWQDLGGLLDIAGGQSAANSVAARKSNNRPVVAWDENDANTGTRNVYVKEWSGSAWSLLGGALDRIGGDAENPSVVVRSDNRPTVAWQENNNVYVRRWSGTDWVNISKKALDTSLANDAITPSIALELAPTADIPVVAYAENGNILVKRANGVAASSDWQSPYGITPLDNTVANEAYRPSLALKSNNQPIVAWYEDAGTSFNIYAK